MKGIFKRSTSQHVVLAVWLLCAVIVNLSHAAQGTQQAPPERALAEQTAFQNAINGIANSVVRIEPSGLSVATLQGSREATGWLEAQQGDQRNRGLEGLVGSLGQPPLHRRSRGP